MQLVELTKNQRLDYNRFVAGQNGSFLQSYEWGMWQEKLGKKVKRFFILDDQNVQVGAVQFVRMPLPWGRAYWYAPYGPVVTSNFNFEILGFKTALQKALPEALFYRVEPQNYRTIQPTGHTIKKTINIQPAITMVVNVTKGEEELLKGMHPKTRYNIRLAQKHGVVIESELTVTPGFGLYAKEAVDLIVQTQIRQNYRGHSEAYYKNLLNFFVFLEKGKSDLQFTVYKALYNRQILASAIMADFGRTRVYLYGGSSEEQRNVMAPYLLHFQAMLDAHAQGLENYDLGGSEVSAGGERGFTRFKQGFGGKVVEYAGAYDLVNNPRLYWWYEKVRMVNLLVRKIF